MAVAGATVTLVTAGGQAYSDRGGSLFSRVDRRGGGNGIVAGTGLRCCGYQSRRANGYFVAGITARPGYGLGCSPYYGHGRGQLLRPPLGDCGGGRGYGYTGYCRGQAYSDRGGSLFGRVDRRGGGNGIVAGTGLRCCGYQSRRANGYFVAGITARPGYGLGCSPYYGHGRGQLLRSPLDDCGGGRGYGYTGYCRGQAYSDRGVPFWSGRPSRWR